jgi:uncharacterized membrane protein
VNFSSALQNAVHQEPHRHEDRTAINPWHLVVSTMMYAAWPSARLHSFVSQSEIVLCKRLSQRSFLMRFHSRFSCIRALLAVRKSLNSQAFTELLVYTEEGLSQTSTSGLNHNSTRALSGRADGFSSSCNALGSFKRASSLASRNLMLLSRSPSTQLRTVRNSQNRTKILTCVVHTISLRSYLPDVGTVLDSINARHLRFSHDCCVQPKQSRLDLFSTPEIRPAKSILLQSYSQHTSHEQFVAEIMSTNAGLAMVLSQIASMHSSYMEAPPRFHAECALNAKACCIVRSRAICRLG